MGDTTQKVILEMLLKDEQFKKELTTAIGKIKQVGTETKKVSDKSGGFLSSMKLAWVAVAAAVYKTIGFAREAVADAMAADRQMRQLAATYSGMGDEAKRMAKEIGDAFAMQDDDVAGLLARLGTLLQNLGLTKAEALDMSGQMVRVAAELAHSWGKTVPEAVGAIQSALTGNARALKTEFGIAIDEASLKQQAFNMGLSDGKRALTQAETAMAAMALVTKGAGSALGSFARDGNTFEVQVQRMTKVLQDLKEAVGHGLIAGLAPTMKDISESMNDATVGAVRFDQIIKVLTGTTVGLVRIVLLAGESIGIALGGAVVIVLDSIVQSAKTVGGAFVTLAETTVRLFRRVGMVFQAIKEHPKEAGAIIKNFFKAEVRDARLALEDMGKKATKNFASLKTDAEALGESFAWIKEQAEQAAAGIGSAFKPIPDNTPTVGGAATPSAPRGNPFVSLFGVTEEDMRDAGTTYEEMLLSNEETWLDIEEAHAAEADRLREEEYQKEVQQNLRVAASAMQTADSIRDIVVEAERQKSQAKIDAINTELAAQTAGIERARAASIADIEASAMTEDQKRAAIDEVNERYDEKAARAERKAKHDSAVETRKQFLFQKQASLMMAIAQGALAVINGLATIPFIPAGIAAGIAAGVATVAQIVAIQGTQAPAIPAYASGGLAGLSGPEMALVGERGPELIIPASQTRQLLAGGAGGGGVTFGQGSIVLNIANGTAQNVERGVMNALKRISDDRGIRNPLSRG